MTNPRKPTKRVTVPPITVAAPTRHKAGKLPPLDQATPVAPSAPEASEPLPTPASPAARAAAASGKKPLSDVAKRRAARRSRAELDAYVRANGSMSVARRTVVVGRSLERLGYTHEQARDISLDAPLDARMHDQDALTAALQYAGTITPENAQANPDDPNIVGADAIIPMPKKAQAALAASQAKKNPVRAKAQRFRFGFLGSLSGLRDRVMPLLDTIADTPVPSGIGGLFALNLLFLCAVVPVNAQGYTRLQLLYLTLLNRTKLPEATPPVHVPASPLFQAAIAGIESVEDAAHAVNNVASALGGDVSKAGNLLQDIGSALGTVEHIIGGGPPDTSTAGAGAGPGADLGGTYLPRPRAPWSSPPVVPSFPGRVRRQGV